MVDLVLVGGGGHCKSVIDSIKALGKYKLIGITDFDKKDCIGGVPIIGKDDQLQILFDSGVRHAFITVGSIGDTSVRLKLYQQLKAIGYHLPVIIDTSAIVSEYATIGEGSFIGKGAVINTDSKIATNCIINSGSIVEHDCTIGDFVHIAPGAVLSGSTNIGSHTHIGTNATVIQNINIGEQVLIGAGSVVISHILKGAIAYGNPCKEKIVTEAE